ncbi:MAG: hypothetical protein ACKORL_13450 [Phycisphaerales bacterium]
MQPAHPSDDGPVLDVEVRCVRCRYDLRGCRIFRACPECGLPAISSVSAHADPGISELSHPSDPGSAAAAVAAIAAAPLVAVLLQGSGPAMRQVDALAGRGSSFPSQVERPAWLVASVALAVATAVAARGLSEARNPELAASLGRGRTVRLLAALGAWSAVLAAAFVAARTPRGGAQSFPLVALAAQVLPSALALTWLSPVLARVGALSRNYREARHGQQSADLVTLTLVACLGLWVTLPAIRGAVGDDWALVAWALAAFMAVITVLGLAYLAANGWVIARSLRRPRIDPRRLR